MQGAGEDDSRNDAEARALREVEKAEKDIELAAEELEKAEQDLKEAREHDVLIVVDGVDRKVRRGLWVVSDLKAALGIEPAKVLAKITPKGLEDLDDAAEVKVHRQEQFMTHARSGGSS